MAKFIVLEGGEGSGKTVISAFLAEYLREHNYPVFLTKEPGGASGICTQIRELLLDPIYKGEFSHRAELFLFEADRAQHVEYTIRPALESGQIVISDRYEASTFAYQCVARGVCAPAEFKKLNHFATGGLQPDFTFWLDVDPEVGLARNKAAGKRTRFEMEDVEFHQKLRKGFQIYFSKLKKSKWQKLDAGLSLEELKKQIAERTKRLL